MRCGDGVALQVVALQVDVVAGNERGPVDDEVGELAPERIRRLPGDDDHVAAADRELRRLAEGEPAFPFDDVGTASSNGPSAAAGGFPPGAPT